MNKVLSANALFSILLYLLFAGRQYGQAVEANPKLHLEQVVADTASVNAVAVEIIGPTEIVLWDAQFHVADATRLADQVAATGKRLKAIVISHPDFDHYIGAGTLLERFPGTPVYMTAAALDEFNQTANDIYRSGKMRYPQQFPATLVTPRLLPSTLMTVDGEKIEVIPDLQGDVLRKSNSVLWIPSLRAVLASDVVFNGVHPWLGASSETSRLAWRESCERIRALHPAIIVAGHKRDIRAVDSPDLLDFMERYLSDFDRARAQFSDATALETAMNQKYPDLALPRLLQSGAKAAFAPK